MPGDLGWRRPARSSFGYPQGKSRGTSCADVVSWCRPGTQAFTRKKVDQGVFLRPAIKLRQPVASEQSISPSIRIAKCDASLIGNWNHLVAGAETGGEGRIQVPDHVAGRTRVEETVDDAMTPEVAAVHIGKRIGIDVDVAVGGSSGEGPRRCGGPPRHRRPGHRRDCPESCGCEATPSDLLRGTGQRPRAPPARATSAHRRGIRPRAHHPDRTTGQSDPGPPA